MVEAVATFPLLARSLIERFPAEAAASIEDAATDQAAALLRELPPPDAAAIVERVGPLSAQRLLEQLDPHVAGAVLQAMAPSRAGALLGRLDADQRSARLAGLPTALAKELAELASYPADRAGALMDPRVMAFPRQLTVGQVLEQLRRLPVKRSNEIFLVDDDGALFGSVPLQSLAIAKPDQPIEALVGPPPVAVQAMSSRNEVVEALEGQKMASVVVLDANRQLLGVVRRDALIQAALEQASADAQAMVGASKEERALSSVRFAVGKRLPWLVINLGTAFLAAAVVGFFEPLIAKFTALAVLLPVVAGQSGNTGAQALAVTMRGLALREVRTRHALRVSLKELSVGLLNGIGIAIICAGAVFVWSRSTGLTLVIGLSMVLSMMAAGLAGATIPMVLTALRQDPAQSSSIVLTTVTDVVGFFSFLGIATALSGMI